MSSQLSVNQAATYFDISHRTVHRWIQSGKVKAEKIDGQWLIEVENVDNQTSDNLSSERHDTVMSLTRQNGQLIKQLESKDQQIEKLQQALDQQQQLHAVSQNTVEAQRLQIEEAKRPQPLLARLKAVFAPE
ncbi:MAG: helix-turn-helix domain-containing protein [Candidatus Poribacteria bacterium]|nr:helix-turn-helix domain-containing protein [Candidatus Poribacteria bacterium]